MTTLNTIIEEEKKEFNKQYGGQRFVYANELTIQDFLATAMQRAYEAGAEERDTYWKERVGEAVKAERDRIAEAAIEIAIKRVQDVLCNYADDNIEDEKLNRIWFKAVVKKALTPITKDNLK